MSAHVVVRDVIRPDASVLAGLAELGVSTVHEADQRRGALDHGDPPDPGRGADRRRRPSPCRARPGTT